MPKVTIETDWYFEVASASWSASAGVRTAIANAVSSLEGCAGMAGDDEVGSAWGLAYDNAIKPIVENACLLSTALGAFGARVNQAGHNHDTAESHAGGKGGVRSTSHQYDALTNAQLTPPPTAVGPSSEDGGVGDSLVGQLIKEQVGSKIPNAQTDRVEAAAATLAGLADQIDAALDSVAHASNNPIDELAGDVRALKAELSSNIFFAGVAIVNDVRSLAKSAQTFAGDVYSKRSQMKSEADSAQRDLEVSGSLAIVGALLSRGSLAPGVTAIQVAVVTARIGRAARRIYSLIKALQALTNVSDAASAIPSTTSSIAAKLRESIDHPSADFEVDENGNLKSLPLFSPLKQKAWEEYLRNGGDYDIEKWSKAYDTLMANASNGGEFDRLVGELMGYTKENGWSQQYVSDEFPNRRWDFANERLREAIENKSGRLDLNQLGVDELALQAGWKVTYNLRSGMSPADLARLERLQQMYPGDFTYQWLP